MKPCLDTVEVWGVTAYCCLNLPFVFGGLELTGDVSVSLPVTLDQIFHFATGSELISSEGPLGLAVLAAVLGDLRLGLARVLSLAIFPLSAVLPSKGSGLPPN